MDERSRYRSHNPLIQVAAVMLFCLLLAGVTRAGRAENGSISANTNEQSVAGSPIHAASVSAAGLSTRFTIPRPFTAEEFTALVEKSSLIDIFQKGGPIMWPLLLASILALGTVFDRAFFLLNEARRRDKQALRRFYEAVHHGDLDGAIRIGNRSKDCVVHTLVYALEHREKSLSNALLFAVAEEMKRFRRGIPILDTVITLAPLLGLLGTVTGMMGSFALIGGELSTPGAITGGIAEALIATTFGLGIAVTSVVPFNFLNTRMERAELEMESAAAQLELLLHAHAAAPVRAPRVSPAERQLPARPVRLGMRAPVMLAEGDQA